MKREEIDNMTEKYKDEMKTAISSWNGCQYDDRSALINYSFIREHKPKVVVEFGTRTGRCTVDMTHALIKNGEPFIYRAYELDNEFRVVAQKYQDDYFGEKAVKIGGDITKATDLPDNIEYLFIDNSHDYDTTKWVFETLIPKCKKGCIVQIHDWIEGCTLDGPGISGEVNHMIELHKEGKFPLEKIYWAYIEDPERSSSWWRLV